MDPHKNKTCQEIDKSRVSWLQRDKQASDGLWKEPDLLDSQDGGLPNAADSWYSVSKVLARWLLSSSIMAVTATLAMINTY